MGFNSGFKGLTRWTTFIRSSEWHHHSPQAPRQWFACWTANCWGRVTETSATRPFRHTNDLSL